MHPERPFAVKERPPTRPLRIRLVPDDAADDGCHCEKPNVRPKIASDIILPFSILVSSAM
jgi:hypothetical protein